ncbi:MAG: MBL fold metallo-hydrolase [bacterium]
MRPSAKITCLVDDCVHQMGLLAEHGLSFLVEANGTQVLLDTGATDVILRNADALSIDLSQIDAVVISHGHYDHTGGLPSLLKRIGAVTIYCHPYATREKLVVREEGKQIYAGPSWNTEDLEKLGARFDYSAQARTIGPGLRVTGEIPRVHPQEPVPAMFQRKTDSGLVHDDMPDDQCLLVETPKGIIVVLACTHAGIINTLDHIDSLTGCQPIRAIIGGLHLVGGDPDRICWTIDRLKPRDIGLMALSHCTGLEATCALMHAFPGSCQTVPAGTVLEFD